MVTVSVFPWMLEQGRPYSWCWIKKKYLYMPKQLARAPTVTSQSTMHYFQTLNAWKNVGCIKMNSVPKTTQHLTIYNHKHNCSYLLNVLFLDFFLLLPLLLPFFQILFKWCQATFSFFQPLLNQFLCHILQSNSPWNFHFHITKLLLLLVLLNSLQQSTILWDWIIQIFICSFQFLMNSFCEVPAYLNPQWQGQVL